jgi:signal peptidase I
VAIPPPRELAEAVATLLEADPARIVALASSLRGPNRVIESTVVGTSMGEGLRPGSRIRIELRERPHPGVGEVIAFLTADQVIVHRVVHRGRGGAGAGHLLTRGDAVLVPDPPLPHGRVIGPVTAVWCHDRWTPLEPPRRWPVHARIASRLALWVAVGSVYLSPRVAGSVLAVLHRAERGLRLARAWGSRRRAPASEPG